ncbi:hypothetical protein BASA83_005815 [Batrachochytrium salamandrivorans]|nr:hypothetical protein BASA83_005815 [Batrachochytrium salamandrivorans]
MKKEHQGLHFSVSTVPAQSIGFGNSFTFADSTSPPSRLPFERWGIDFYGPMAETKSGNRYLITCIDYATRWVLAKPVKEMTEFCCCCFSLRAHDDLWCPFEIISDRGSLSWPKESTCLSAKQDSALGHYTLIILRPMGWSRGCTLCLVTV